LLILHSGQPWSWFLCLDAIETRSLVHRRYIPCLQGPRELSFVPVLEVTDSSNLTGRRLYSKQFSISDLQTDMNKPSLVALAEGYFTAALSADMYLAISTLAPTAASNQTAAIATKAMMAAVDLISSFLRISAALAS
jgi:hypothetical protein